MALTLEVYTIGSGDTVQEVFNAIAAVFNNTTGIAEVTHLAILFGGFCSVFQFIKSKDVKTLLHWAGWYVVATSLLLYPKATVAIVDQTDSKPRIISHVPLSLASFASFTSRIGLGLAEMVETVFHMPDDMAYNKTGMLMGSKLVLASQDFQITDPVFSQTLNEFMQQCVFYDFLLGRYTIDDVLHQDDPWTFIATHTSQARAFPLNNEIVICKKGASQLSQMWLQERNHAAEIYGVQIFGNTFNSASTLISRLSAGYSLLTHVSEDGYAILQKDLLANAISQAVKHYGANVNAPAALVAFEDSKTELQIRHTLDVSGRQAGYWLQQCKNKLDEIMYGSFLFIYFLSYFPFGIAIIRNYLIGMFYLQTLAPMFAIVNFTTTYYAESRSLLFSSQEKLSLANMSGITQANADAMALAGYLSWIVALGGGIVIFRGLPQFLQSAGQYVGGVVQNAASHISAEAVAGNISAGNTSFSTHSRFNTNANHFDTNARHASQMVTLQTSTGSTFSSMPDGNEVLNTQGAISNLPVDIRVAQSIRTAAAEQAQSNYTAGYNETQSAGQHYTTALRKVDDYATQKGHSLSNGENYSETKSTGLSHSASNVWNLVERFAKDHHVTHEKAAQVLGEVYASGKVGFSVFGNQIEGGASARASLSGRSAFGSLYNHAEQYARDQHLSEAVDRARRDAKEEYFRKHDDFSERLSQSITRSFDEGDNYRSEAASHYSRAENYSKLASTTTENASTINANYSQEFYKWLRKQQPVNGHGLVGHTMSRSMIDGMNPEELQPYADLYTREKTTQAIQSFNDKNHISQGASYIKGHSQANNHLIPSKAEINRQDKQYQNEVLSKSEHLKEVDSSLQNKVQTQMARDEGKRQTMEHVLQSESHPLEERIREKVKGQVVGSLNFPKSLLHSGLEKQNETKEATNE